MAIINRSTFNIYDGSTDPKTVKNSFECDDMIAPIIRTLNLKGYTTRFCCGGHPYIEENKLLAFSDTRPTNDIVCGTYSIRKSPRKRIAPISGEQTNCYIVRYAEYLGREAYISFKEGCVPDVLPKSWDYQKEVHAIYYPFMGDYLNPFDFFKEQIKCMEQLQKWADSLEPKKA